MLLRLQCRPRPLLALSRSFAAAPVKPVDDAVAARRQQSIYYARLTRKYPAQLGSLSMEAVDRTARFLTNRGLNQTQALRAISRHVLITGYSQKMMESKSSYLINVFPEVAAFSMAKLDEKVDVLKELGCNDDQVARILTMAPRVLGYSVEKIQTNVDYLEEMGVPPEHIPAIMARVPQFLGLKTSRIKETMDAVEEMFGDGAGVMALVGNSRILMHNISEIRRAYNYLRSIGFTKERLKQCTRFVMRNENRILRPRVKFLEAKGVNVVANSSWILMPEGRFIERYSDYAVYLIQYKAQLKKKKQM
ncbi:hypothetical protein, variant 1 [Phytophthora nicotianae CJ01A1]|uniref:Uncharacterized protein n=3 Tax=Phytophthora nicotianae TaxID=4792 RepID=V9E692_PHYNI|nr:hypothetical protein, variant 1 [Phytophthora nicotianae P1569]ETK74844.1 hypothetical protein, variant 1 [Phytophthora nicotianae]ETM34722.1 hypothetical protein, variant 1 [Phytophthora nicotianae]ETP04389.1 hypothetical protein, variant 1 [Phytophthora nicotianae CJ01A1]